MSAVEAPPRPSPWEGAPWEPRKWQREMLPSVRAALAKGERTVVHAGTGSGKSVGLTEIVYLTAALASDDEVVVVSTPTQNLVKQLSRTVAARCGKRAVGVYYGRKKQPERRIIVTCNPSLSALADELALAKRRVRLLVADECHGTEAETLKEAIPGLAPRWLVGFTATPFRSVESESLSLFQSVCFSYGLADALRDRVLVPWTVINWDGHGDGATDAVCVEMIRKHGEGPGIVSALSIDDAESYAERLCAEGIEAQAIHSRLPDAEQEARIKALQEGRLRCLVHVALLAEGVDLPWLRWLCLRRPVGARVRFVQEVGRVLRVHPGKRRAVVMDPHDLFGLHGLPSSPAVGVNDAAIEAFEASIGERKPSEGPSEEKELPLAKAIDASTRWARSLLLALQAAGIAKNDAVEAGTWRTRRPSDRQITALVKMGRTWSRYLPDAFRGQVLALSREDVARRLQRGAVSDLLSVLMAVANQAPEGGWEARKGWKLEWPEGLEIEPLPEDVVKEVAA